VAVSGWGRDEDKLRATEAGFDVYLTKPVNPQVLSDLIAEGFSARSSSSPGIEVGQ
jgi:DNA-binding response OmpR family regulator